MTIKYTSEVGGSGGTFKIKLYKWKKQFLIQSINQLTPHPSLLLVLV
jgi:hypothetical protein